MPVVVALHPALCCQVPQPRHQLSDAIHPPLPITPTHHPYPPPLHPPLHPRRYTRTLSAWAGELGLTGGVHFVGGSGGGGFGGAPALILVLAEGAWGDVREFLVRCALQGYNWMQYECSNCAAIAKK